MALSRELRRRLLVEDEPLTKRLKLAENTFTSTDIRVTNKEDLVLKWLCQATGEDANGDKIIWSALKRCLEFKSVSSEIGLKSDTKQSLVETLISKLTRVDSSHLDDVSECWELVFASCEMRRYFLSKPARLGESIKAVLRFRTAEGASLARQCTASAVVCLVMCFKQSSEKDEFVFFFVREILYPLCRWIDKTCHDRLDAEIHKCIRQLLFAKARYTHFKDYEAQDENNFARRLFVELRKSSEIAENGEEEINIVVFLYIFRAAVGSYKSDPSVIDAIFRNLVDSAGLLKAKLLNRLGEHLTNITFDYQNKIGETALFQYLENFIDEILLEKQLRSSDYDALAAIAVLNPLILEAKLPAILNRIMLERKETKSERDSYGNLIIGILEAQVRLRREQKLVPWMLTAVKQSLCGKNDLKTSVAFPDDFKNEFSKSVSNMTSAQTTDLLRSLIFHLKYFCVETSVTDKNTITFLLQANVDLIVAYFKGVRIYDRSTPLPVQQKFVVALVDLGKIIALLTDKVLSIKSNKKMIVSLLTIAWYWDNVYNWMKYYVPDAVPKTLEFPITDGRMKQLFSNCNNSECKKAMNRILVQQMGRNLQGGVVCLDVSRLLGGLEKSWMIIVDENPRMMTSMDNTEIDELARLLLDDVKSSGGNCSESLERLKTENVQNDERFVKALVGQTLTDVATNIDSSMTKSVIGHVNSLKNLDREEISKILKEVKREYEKNQWTIIDRESIFVIEDDLRILLNLPLTHLSRELRTLIFLAVCAVKKECGPNHAISEFCTQVMFDVSEKMDIDIIDYVEPSLLIKELTQSQVIRRVLVSSLRNITSWKPLKELIKKSEGDKESVALLLDCMEKVKTKLKNDRKELFKKAQHKLGKKLLDSMETEMKDHIEVRSLARVLKVYMADDEIPEHLVDVVKSTMDRVFVSEGTIDEKHVEEGFQLLKIVLNQQFKFKLDERAIMHIWSLVMKKNPSKDVVLPLFQTSISDAILGKVLNLLHKQTISGLAEKDGTRFANSLVVWDAIVKVDLGPTRNTLRIAAILRILEALLVSPIPTESWPGVLRLIRSIFSNHAYAAQQDIDIILLLAVRSLREIKLSACEDILGVCYTLVKLKVDFITDRLPVLLLLYGQLVRLVVRESRKEPNSSSERRLRCLALDVAKFTGTLVKLKKDLSRISPHTIANLVEMFSEGVIPSYVKGPLEDSVGHILSICDQHAISLLSRALPTATRGIFKTIYENYKKFYKFTGQI